MIPVLVILIVNAVFTYLIVHYAIIIYRDDIISFLAIMASRIFWYIAIPLSAALVMIFFTWFYALYNLIYVIRYDGKMLSISICDQDYTGKEIRLCEKDIVVKDGETILRPSVDYKIMPDSYRNNLKRGEASVNIRLYNDYSGFYKATYIIK